LILLGAPPSVRAQEVEGTRIQLDVSVVSVVRSADTTRVSYVLNNRASSVERMLAFTVEAPTIVAVSYPIPVSSWQALIRYASRHVAQWAALNDSLMQPGTRSQVLTLTAIGLPAVVDAHVEGFYELPVYADAAEAPLEDPLQTRAVHLRVVGVAPVPPGATPLDLARRLIAQRDEACRLGWADVKGVCNSLDAKLDAAVRALTRDDTAAAMGELEAFLNELDAQRGQHLNDAAYFLLKINAEYLRGRL
jgi:hypothetical protein